MSSFTMTSSSASLLSSKVRCPTLDMMLRKTILALCEVNVRYNLKLEVSGSLHIRSDDDRVLTCLIDEQLMGPGRHHLTNTGGLPNYIRRAATSATVQPLKFLESMESENNPVDLSGGNDEKSKMSDSVMDEKYNMTDTIEEDKMKLLTQPEEISCQALPNGRESESAGADQPTDSTESPNCDEPGESTDANGFQQQQESAEPTTDAVVGQECAVNDVAEMSPVSSEKSLQPETFQEEQYMVLDLSNTSENSNIRCVSVNGTTTTLNGMAMNAVMQNDIITQQMAALSQMAEMMQRNVGMVLPTPALPANPSFQQPPSTPSPESQSPMNNAQTPPADADSNGVVKIEPQDPNSAISPTANPNLPQMLVNPMASPTGRFNLSAVDPLTIGNPVQTKTGAKKWQCVFCGILVSSKFYLSSHINAVHTRTRIYPCEMCGKIFYSHGAQRIHKLRNHWVEKRHKCPHCGQLFVLPFELRQHITRKHKNIVPPTPQPAN